MNKKLTRFILATLLAIFALIPALPQQARAYQEQQTITRISFVNQFNAMVILFDQSVFNAQTLLGVPRVIFISSAGLGIPVHELEVNFTNLGLPLNQFLMAQIIAHSGNVSINWVVDRFLGGQSFGEIALAINTPLRLTTTRVTGFINVFAHECGLASGQITLDVTEDQLTKELEDLLKMADARMQIFLDNVGEDLFTQLFFNRLSIETGIATDVLFNARVNIPREISLAQFAAAVLIDDSLEGTLRLVLQNNGSIFSPSGLISAINARALLSQLLNVRMIIFTRALASDVADESGDSGDSSTVVDVTDVTETTPAPGGDTTAPPPAGDTTTPPPAGDTGGGDTTGGGTTPAPGGDTTGGGGSTGGGTVFNGTSLVVAFEVNNYGTDEEPFLHVVLHLTSGATIEVPLGADNTFQADLNADGTFETYAVEGETLVMVNGAASGSAGN